MLKEYLPQWIILISSLKQILVEQVVVRILGYIPKKILRFFLNQDLTNIQDGKTISIRVSINFYFG